MKTPILGSSYVARSINAADARMVNLFPELVPEGGKDAAFLSRVPGLTNVVNVGIGPIRGMLAMGNCLYVLSGRELYQINSDYTYILVSTLPPSDGLPVNMAYGISDFDGSYVFFMACNGPAYFGVGNANGLGTFGQFNPAGFQGAISVSYLNGFFLFNQPNSQNIWLFDIRGDLDKGFDPTNFKPAAGSPDQTVGLIVDHKEVWIFGTNSTEVWYYNSAPQYPFGPIQGAFSEIGCAAPYTIAKMDNSVFWLSSDDRGHGIVYRAEGYSGKRISTHAVEWQIQQYGDLSKAQAYTYQQDGHAFYVLIFPNQRTSWVYDVSTQAWHERASFVNGEFARHRGNCQAFFNNQVLIGDYQSGQIYKYDLNAYGTDKWLRTWRALAQDQNDLNRSSHHSLQIDCETGTGLVNGQGSDPQVMLRWSDDGGHTWSNEHWAGMGKIGSFNRRVIFRRLGMTRKLRDRVYELSGSDPVKVTIMGAELHTSQTNA